jgi:uncharacterized protein (DUF4415 family)
MTERKRSKAEERAFARFNDSLTELDALRRTMQLEFARLRLENVPPAWASIETRHPVRPKKVRINATYDAEVAGFFRSMGHGYQARMNAVLRTFMKAVVSKEILTHGDRDRNGDQIWGLPDRGK